MNGQTAKLAVSNRIINPLHHIIDSTPHAEPFLCAQVSEYIRDVQKTIDSFRRGDTIRAVNLQAD
jgi:hypothetical protein